MKKSLKVIIVVVIVLATLGSTAISAVTLSNQSKLAETVGEIRKTQEQAAEEAARAQEFSEDGVMIASRYEIRSTSQISDAYKSGDRSGLNDADKETLDMASAVIKDVITDGMSDYEKEIAIYTYLTKNMTGNAGALNLLSDGTGEYYTPHDVLKYKSAVCVGYATTFRMFMQMLDIECMVVHSTELTHSWDLIHLDDGWYHTDCYSDSGTGNFYNFNMNDSRCSMGHDWERDNYPAADGTKYDYALSVCETIDDIYALPEWYLSKIDERVSVMSCVFKEKITDENAAIASQLANTLQNDTMNDHFSSYFFWEDKGDDGYALCILVSYNDNGYNEENELDEETLTKINDAINDAINGHDFYDNYGYSGGYYDESAG